MPGEVSSTHLLKVRTDPVGLSPAPDGISPLSTMFMCSSDNRGYLDMSIYSLHIQVSFSENEGCATRNAALSSLQKW